MFIKNSSSAVAASSSSSSCRGLLLEGGGIKNKKPSSIIFLSLSTTPSIHRHRHGLIFRRTLSTAHRRLPPPPLWKRRARHFVQGVAAAAENVGGGGDEIADVEINNDNDALSSSSSILLSSPSSSNMNTNTNTNTNSDILYIGVVLGCWYLFNIYFNIYNKQILEVFPFPLTISALQFGVGSLLIFVMWTTKLYKLPKISTSQLLAIIPLAIVHTFGNVFTNMSLGKVAVSFTHTVKAMEPFFSVFLSALFLGEVPSIWVLSSLVPVVGGVALASMTEVSFNWLGFWSAMASNLANQSRNVLSKKIMIRKEESLDNITLFSIMTIMSFFLSVPVALFVEGNRLNPSYIQSAGLNLMEVYSRSLLAAFCFHAYSQAGYMVLSRLSPVSHSVANCVKRVVVIVSSVLFFRTPVSLINSLGTGIALAGVFLYSRVNKIKVETS